VSAAEAGVAELAASVAEIVGTVLVRAAVGGVISGLSDLTVQVGSELVFHQPVSVDWGQVGTSVAIGGALSGVTAAIPALASGAKGLVVRSGDPGVAPEAPGGPGAMPPLPVVPGPGGLILPVDEIAVGDLGAPPSPGSTGGEPMVPPDRPVTDTNTVRGELPLSASDSWCRPDRLARHFRDHGGDFGSTSADEYASQASRLFQRSQQDELPTKVDQYGVIRVYDPKTNEFGAYNPDGTTRSYFAPHAGQAYYDRQPGSPPWSRG
jgi:hypothetical protein